MLSSERLPLLLIAVNVDGNHWCALVANVSAGIVTVFDPQQCRDRIKQLKAVAVKEIFPLLPGRETGYKFAVFPSMTQVDNYNCGLFVLIFFEAMLSGSSVSDIDDDDDRKELMQLFRYKYLCYSLSNSV